MKKLDLDRDLVDLIFFLVAAGLVFFAQFRPTVNDRLYEFSLLAAGSGMRGLGTHQRKDNHYEDDSDGNPN